MTTVIAKRIVLRLDPGQLHAAALARALHLAQAFHAELAARMIADTRLAGAFAIAGTQPPENLETQFRRAESGFRRELAALVAGRHAAWSFEVIRCAGLLAGEGVAAADDLVAIELPRFEPSMFDLRREIVEALSRARGVLLFPAAMSAPSGPVVAITAENAAPELVETSRQIAASLSLPARVITHDGPTRERQDVADIATTVRRLGAALTVVDARDPIAAALLARPRYLREMATPLLLLNLAA